MNFTTIVVTIMLFVTASIRGLISRTKTDSTDWTIICTEATAIITLTITFWFRFSFKFLLESALLIILPMQSAQDVIDLLE